MDGQEGSTITLAEARKITDGIRVTENGNLRDLSDNEALNLTKEARYWACITYRVKTEPLVRHIREALGTAQENLRETCVALTGLDEQTRMFIVGDDEELFVRLLAPVLELEQRLEDAIKQAQQYAEDTGRASGGQPREENIYKYVAVLVLRYKGITNRRPGKTIDSDAGRPSGPFGNYLCRSLEAFWPSKVIPWGSVRKALEYCLSFETELDPEWSKEVLPDQLKKHINPI